MAMDFEKLFKSFSGVRIGVIGDVMLDTYWWGHVDRISPEAPVPVVALDKKEYRVGGAGNVALNLASLGAEVSILSVTGDDDDAKILDGLFKSENINTKWLLKSKNRLTANKSRIISRNQQMMRLDSEITADLSNSDFDALLKKLDDFVSEEKPQVLIFEDYNKGVLTENLIQKAIAVCKQNHIVTAVDPKRKNFFAYKGVDIFKPNMKEVKDGLNLLVDDIRQPVLEDIHEKLKQKLNHNISFITLSDKGV